MGTLEPQLDDGRPSSWSWDDYAAWLTRSWPQALDDATDESSLQKFLEWHPALLPGAAVVDGPPGHHGPFLDAVISQPGLISSTRKRIPDFMWVRRDTAAIRPFCIEIEDPHKRWFTKEGHQTEQLSQALNQIIEWREWFRAGTNASQFKEAYVPPDCRHRRVEPVFALVYGRDEEFRRGSSSHDDPEYLRQKRDLVAPDVQLWTYDMLRPSHDAKDCVTLKGVWSRLSLVSVPPTFTMGSGTDTDLLLQVDDPAGGLAATGLIDVRRRDYLRSRWAYWRSVATKTTVRSTARGE